MRFLTYVIDFSPFGVDRWFKMNRLRWGNIYIIAIGYVMCVGLFHYLQYCAVIELEQIYAF